MLMDSTLLQHSVLLLMCEAAILGFEVEFIKSFHFSGQKNNFRGPFV